MKIVQFKDGTFGVREWRGFFTGYVFLDGNITWHESAYDFCRFQTREIAGQQMAWRKRVDAEHQATRKKLKDKGVPV